MEKLTQCQGELCSVMDRFVTAQCLQCSGVQESFLTSRGQVGCLVPTEMDGLSV